MMHSFTFISQVSVLILVIVLCAASFNTINCCNEEDQRALLMFKQGIIDPSNRLSDWSTNQDCCSWTGVECDQTGFVDWLYLGNKNQNASQSLRGDINFSSLLQLHSLNYLDLSYNDFQNIIISSNIANFSKLQFLDLSFNPHLHIHNNLHYWLHPLSSLAYLSLSGIDLHNHTNSLHSISSSLPSLSYLYLKDCKLTNIHPSVENNNVIVNVTSLQELDLAENDFSSELPNWMLNLSNHLFLLNLSHCNLRGPILDFSHYKMLHYLILSNNSIKGTIPDWLGQLDFLYFLDLSHNLFYGFVPSSLSNISNSLLLDISFNSLSGNLPKSVPQPLGVLDLSHNSLSGDLSEFLLTSSFILMASNKFEGDLPHVSNRVKVLDLGNNYFSKSLAPLLCHTENDYNRLEYLDVSNNVLSGNLPDCWNYWKALSCIYLGSNQLSGEIPPTMKSLLQLRSLDLQDNEFSGHIPMFFRNWTSLELINLERNNFSGSISDWMPQNIAIVKLRSNQFIGNMAPHLCSLFNLIVLDLADNKLSGFIPHCLYKLTPLVSGVTNTSFTFTEEENDEHSSKIIQYSFKIVLSTKGQKLEYSKNLRLVRSLDLSSNNLSGEIPAELFWLIGLQSLNLSYNRLTGKIADQIGGIRELESLDLSHNKLNCRIPQSISDLSFLSYLNLSYNNFNGQIPMGTQLQGFDEWSFIENPELCGSPLKRNCTKPEMPNHKQLAEEEDEAEIFLKSLYLGMGVGFAVGFWVICGSLFFNRSWRHTFFRFFDAVVNRIYVIVALKLRR